MSSEQPLPKQSEAQDGVRWMGGKEARGVPRALPPPPQAAPLRRRQRQQAVDPNAVDPNAFSAFARFPSRFGGASMLQARSCFTRL